ncbi:hypothetical protein AOL_s00176g33 [Orbilia oligospora ATCC 24927]|uniref:Prion-inhibition and propagation HeLo domain-containing protein n=1 Tax=Arthrobotrys oligospora (strain ATCC 24927 / CBS 115.81 / DSM 1491) TaxID=756982 RepID=G1XPQ9_ARTOA|nr:hypothetical protein AOL_s00176g33 [Orbilia oligospora ATCC 24927]EGX44862.1 hypothetical protein AOL_s00176g33 [Orbilia oligospora ATCC 24927]
MEVYTTASTAIHDIYAITVFIRTVIQDVKQRQQALEDIQAQLEHEFLFLETFNILFFGDDDRSGPWFRSLPDLFQRDLNNILTSLRRCLDAYDNVALKHGLNLSEANSTLGREDKQDESSTPDTLPSESSKNKVGRYRSIIEQMTKKIAWKERMKKLEWALFDQEEVKKLTDQYREWTERLRQVMTLILLMSGNLGGYAISDLGVDVGAKISKALGVTKAVRRQIRAKSEVPKKFPALEGSFDSDGNGRITKASSYTVGVFHDQQSGSYNAIMETHDFIIVDDGRSERERQEMKLELVRRLAWLLQGDISTAESTDPNNGTAPMYLLQCLGYYVLGTKLSLIYKVPSQGGTPTTLHDWMIHDERKEYELVEREKAVREKEKNPKPSSREKWEILKEKNKILEERKKLEAERQKQQANLSDRYFIAWALASTLYNIHASGWVHKDIWSRAILVFRAANAPLSSQRIIPYLLGWSVSRPQTEEYRDVSKRQIPNHKNKDDLEDNPDADGEIENGSDSDPGSDEESESSRAQVFDLEHELYRHPERYYGKTATYENKHDIYSLGVVLLEIGLWSTISIEMSTAIDTARKSSSAPPTHIMERLQEQIRLKSEDQRLANQMGPGYAEIVRRCLTGSFDCLKGNSKSNDGGDAELTREFHELVVEPLRLRATMG